MYILCALCGLAMLRAPLSVFVCSATSKSLYTSHATLYSLYMVCAPMQSPFASQPQKSPHITRNLIESLYASRTFAVSIQSKAQESLPIFCHPCSPLIPRAPLQSPFAPQPQESPPCHKTLCSLNNSRKALQSSYEQKRKSLCLLFCACSLHTLRPPQ